MGNDSVWMGNNWINNYFETIYWQFFLQITDVREVSKANLIFSMVSWSCALMEASKADSGSILVTTKAVFPVEILHETTTSVSNHFILQFSFFSIGFLAASLLKCLLSCVKLQQLFMRVLYLFWFFSPCSLLSVPFQFPSLVWFLFNLLVHCSMSCSAADLCLPQLFFQLFGGLANKITAETREGLPYNIVHSIFTRCQSFCPASVPFFGQLCSLLQIIKEKDI